MRSKLRTAVAVPSLVVGVVISQVVVAQTDGNSRRRGGRGFPISAVRLATANEVRAELKLDAQQQQKAEQISNDLRDEIRGAFQSGGGFEQIQQLNDDAWSKLAEVLNAEQQQRLLGLSVQVNGPAAIADPGIIDALELNAEQKTNIIDIRRNAIRSFRDAFQQLRDEDTSRDKMRSKLESLRTDVEKKMLDVLSAEQQQRLEGLKGAPLEIDLLEFRGFRARGGNRSSDQNDAEQSPSAERDATESAK